MNKLASINKYFIKYKWHLLSGIFFVAVSCFFTVRRPFIIRNIIDHVQRTINQHNVTDMHSLMHEVFIAGMELLGLALLSGLFMFFMRQTLIVMSRLIEYDQKTEIYTHYQQLHTGFFKSHYTGDLMNRISEDVSRVRMYTGPSVMYATNMVVLTIMCLWNMIRVNPMLTFYVFIPLPVMAITIYYVNRVIYKKSSKIQAQLSSLTTTAQETYSGIRVIKSFVQEKNMLRFFQTNSEEYRKSSINLSVTEAFYFPSMNLFIGLSMLSTVLIGGYYVIIGQISIGNIVEFVLYINLLMFPISSIGMVASMVQRASASQQRIDEFLSTPSEIVTPTGAVRPNIQGNIDIENVTFTYPHTGIKALKDFTLHVKAGQKVALIGKTGSGKSTIAHLLLRMYDPQQGNVVLDGTNVRTMQLQELRRQVAYTPQEAYLFSDTVYNNIKFGRDDATDEEVKEAARLADMEKDIAMLANGYETMIGERGVMLSGGQKQRLVLARALLKRSNVLILDETLSAVDTQTEQTILGNLLEHTRNKTTLVITHRIFTSWTFDAIVVIDDGRIVEQGTHAELMALNGRYAKLYRHQTESATEAA
ncbi:MAG: ABC transporter ATP-binding protein [Flavipsychrobacter sp.]|nr:ABC transporter ATP-binding protein [Flavipsychrobacter sp.]